MPKGFGLAFNTKPLQTRLYKAVCNQDIKLFWELNNRYRVKHGHASLTEATIGLLEALKEEPDNLKWLFDNVKVIPHRDPEGKIISFHMEEKQTNLVI